MIEFLGSCSINCWWCLVLFASTHWIHYIRQSEMWWSSMMSIVNDAVQYLDIDVMNPENSNGTICQCASTFDLPACFRIKLSFSSRQAIAQNFLIKAPIRSNTKIITPYPHMRKYTIHTYIFAPTRYLQGAAATQRWRKSRNVFWGEGGGRRAWRWNHALSMRQCPDGSENAHRWLAGERHSIWPSRC